MTANPWDKFFWQDYENDPALKLCSMAAQGLWMRMLCICAKSEPKGFLMVAGEPLTLDDMASLFGKPAAEIETLLKELEKREVFSRNRAGTIYNRRMIRAAKKAQTARQNGQNGGNPNLRKQTEIPASDNQTATDTHIYVGTNGETDPPTNLPGNSQKPEARSQEPSPPVVPLAGDAKATKVPKRKPETDLPGDWTLPDDWAAESRAKYPGLDVRREGERFKNHAHQNERKVRNWQAAWRNWIDKAAERAGIQPHDPKAPPPVVGGVDDRRFAERLTALHRAGYAPAETAAMNVRALSEAEFQAKLAARSKPQLVSRETSRPSDSTSTPQQPPVSTDSEGERKSTSCANGCDHHPNDPNCDFFIPPGNRRAAE